MNASPKPVLAIASIQVQSSYQAVPLGAACIASALRSDHAIADLVSVRLVDFSLEDPKLSGLSALESGMSIARDLASLYQVPVDAALGVPIAGFSVYVWNRAIFEAAAIELRKLVPNIVIFAGGPEITANDNITRVRDGEPFDYLVRGEGESASRALVRAILGSAPIPSEIAAGKRVPDEDCIALGSPWLDGSLDDTEAVREFKGALWELARGCPYNCAYCYESKGSKKVRSFPADRLEKELDRFVSTGTERVFVLDPTYNASRDRALALLRLIEKKAPEIHFNFEVRAELLDREMAASFSRIACSLQIGLQSSNVEALKLVNRPVDIAQFTKKIALLNDAGVTFGLDLMYGLPGDTLSAFRSSVDYAIGLYPNNLEIFRLAVLPGTALADRAQELKIEYRPEPPYHVISTPKFPAQDLERAANIAHAADVFYTQGRAVTWFLSALAPLKLKGSQFLQDFALFLADPAMRKKYGVPETCKPGCSRDLSHREAERLQLAFLALKYREKGKAHLAEAVKDIVTLNGAWTRAFAEGEETELELSYQPDDLFGPDAMDIEYFCENAYMERCRIRLFPTDEGPDYSVLE